jgi:hypothetical protein
MAVASDDGVVGLDEALVDFVPGDADVSVPA